VAVAGATVMYGRGGLPGRFLLAAAVVVVAVQARFCLR